jgi:hypothetical protein
LSRDSTAESVAAVDRKKRVKTKQPRWAGLFGGAGPDKDFPEKLFSEEFFDFVASAGASRLNLLAQVSLRCKVKELFSEKFLAPCGSGRDFVP